MADKVSKSGMWVNTQTGKVVESQPEEGVQIVPPGFEVTPAIQAQLDLLKAPSATAGPVDLSVSEGAPVKAVTTSDVAGKKRV